MPVAVGIVADSYNKPASGGWTPASLPGLRAWYDAADASTFTYSSGVVVSQWRDKSGLGKHLNQSTGASQPSRNATQNGLACVAFDGSDDHLNASGVFTTGSWTTSNPHTMIVVARLTGTLSGGVTYTPMSADNARSRRIPSDMISMINLESGVYFGTNARILISRFAGDATSSISVDGGVAVSGDVGTAAWTDLQVGRYYYGESWQGNICEVVCMSGLLTSTDQSSLVPYAKAKWGIA